MPLYSNQGQYQNTRRRARGRRYQRRRNQRTAMIVIIVLIFGIAGTAIWAALHDREKPSAVLELPENIQLQSVTVADTVLPMPEDFVTGLADGGITVSFKEQPEKTIGDQTVTLVFSNGEETCTRQAALHVFHLEQKVTVLMGEEKTPEIGDFVRDESLGAEFAGTVPDLLPQDQCGNVTLTVLCAGREYEVIYSVEERIPPQAAAQRIEAEAGTVPSPESLVTDIQDHSAVTVTYQQEPELTIVGSYPVTLVLTDAYGNTATVDSVIDVIPAANAPQFEGLTDLHVQVGNTISYKTGVTAVDPQDGEVSFTVDAAGVDKMTEGTYIVYYSAADTDGNTTIVPRNIIVEDAARVAVERYAQAVLDQIITPNMTRDQKIYAVYRYSRKNVLFVGTSDKTSIVHAAYEGFTTGAGDCYTYYAMNVIMLNMLGIENLEVTRVGGTSHHWWNLVLHEDGKYYHVDSCPTAVKVDGVDHSKMTDSDLAVYTEDKTVAARRPNFYVYDKTLPEYEGIEIAP